MKQVYVLFACDVWHRHESKCLAGIFETKEMLISALLEVEPELKSEDVELLRSINQTQGFSGEGEFMIEEMELNSLKILN